MGHNGACVQHSYLCDLYGYFIIHEHSANNVESGESPSSKTKSAQGDTKKPLYNFNWLM